MILPAEALQRLKRIAAGTASAEDVRPHAEPIARYLEGGISFEDTARLATHWSQDAHAPDEKTRSEYAVKHVTTGSAWSHGCSVATDLRRYQSLSNAEAWRGPGAARTYPTALRRERCL